MTSAEHLNKTVWATLKASPIQGVGVFAIRDIPKGTIITDNSLIDLMNPKSVIYINESEFVSILPEIRALILDKILFCNEKTFQFFSPNHETCLQSFMNHSDNPNSDGEIALRDIAKDEEIVINYRDLDGFDKINHYSKEHNKYLFEK